MALESRASAPKPPRSSVAERRGPAPPPPPGAKKADDSPKEVTGGGDEDDSPKEVTESGDEDAMHPRLTLEDDSEEEAGESVDSPATIRKKAEAAAKAKVGVGSPAEKRLPYRRFAALTATLCALGCL